MIYAPEARKLIKQMVPWIEGKELNRGTFEKCVQLRLLPAVRKDRNKAATFDKIEVERFAKLFPATRPPDKKGIVNALIEIVQKKQTRKRRA